MHWASWGKLSRYLLFFNLKQSFWTGWWKAVSHFALLTCQKLEQQNDVREYANPLRNNVILTLLSSSQVKFSLRNGSLFDKVRTFWQLTNLYNFLSFSISLSVWYQTLVESMLLSADWWAGSCSLLPLIGCRKTCSLQVVDHRLWSEAVWFIALHPVILVDKLKFGYQTALMIRESVIPDYHSFRSAVRLKGFSLEFAQSKRLSVGESRRNEKAGSFVHRPTENYLICLAHLSNEWLFSSPVTVRFRRSVCKAKCFQWRI